MTKETIEVEVSNDTVALEVAYGIIGRAGQIHRNPDDEYEWLAEELKEVGNDLRERYE
jgi:hypothetical protein